jgi:hypothetical protein
MPRVTNAGPLGLATLVAGATLAWAGPAAASYPCSTYVVPSRVELQPSDDAATRVVIHGAFLQLTSDTAMSYGDPRCGVMYFACVAGQEEMCRMQWNELRAAVSPTPQLCQGFGSWNVLSTAALREEGAPLGTPDAWDLGMGITQGAYLDNKCPPALHLTCPVSSRDSGVITDAAPPVDAALKDAAPKDAAPKDAAPKDAAAIDAPQIHDAAAVDVAPHDAPAPKDAAPPPHDARADRAAPGAAVDAGATGTARSGGWCAVATSTPTPLSAAPLAFALLVLASRRRPRAGR